MLEKLRQSLQDHLNLTLPQARLAISHPPDCPEIPLYLIDPDSINSRLSSEEISAVLNEPAYWTFCWASGQALARRLLRHPQLVAGRVVLDFGTGSGIVAIAAALAGAARVIACDNDPAAILATKLNAQLNQVHLEYSENWFDWQETVDLLTAADVLYDKDNHFFLGEFKTKARQVLLADSRVKQLPDSTYQLLATDSASSWPDLGESDEFNAVRLYEWRGGLGCE